MDSRERDYWRAKNLLANIIPDKTNSHDMSMVVLFQDALSEVARAYDPNNYNEIIFNYFNQFLEKINSEDEYKFFTQQGLKTKLLKGNNILNAYILYRAACVGNVRCVEDFLENKVNATDGIYTDKKMTDELIKGCISGYIMGGYPIGGGFRDTTTVFQAVLDQLFYVPKEAIKNKLLEVQFVGENKDSRIGIVAEYAYASTSPPSIKQGICICLLAENYLKKAEFNLTLVDDIKKLFEILTPLKGDNEIKKHIQTINSLITTILNKPIEVNNARVKQSKYLFFNHKNSKKAAELRKHIRSVANLIGKDISVDPKTNEVTLIEGTKKEEKKEEAQQQSSSLPRSSSSSASVSTTSSAPKAWTWEEFKKETEKNDPERKHRKG